MDTDFSKQALLSFADMLVEKGLAKPNTAGGLRVAAAKILDDDVADVRTVDVALAIKRYNNKNPGKLSPASLAEYEKRVVNLTKEFVRYHEDPAGYTGLASRAGTAAPRRDRERSSSKSGAKPSEEVTTAGPPPRAPRSGLSLEYPLRPDFLAQVVVPLDMKVDEARRLCAFVMTLAADFDPMK